MRIIITVLVSVICIARYSKCIQFTNVIELPQGRLRGRQDLNGAQSKYLGVPYASVAERFQEPGEPPNWEGILHAVNGAISCTQYIPRLKIPTGQENCLVLNIYTPGENESKRLPVMVFIHGGGYYWGSGTSLIYDPSPLVQKGVIVVTVNYRVGAFGFLCLRIKDAAGNAGLKDQVAALQWVQQNIQYFGGDHRSVTLFGHSAGSASVNYLILSQAAKGLFNKAILQSGTALSPFAFGKDPIDRASSVAAKLGYYTKDPYELLRIFRNASANEIIMASVADDKVDPFAPYIFIPCAERPGIDAKTFITKSPKEILESGNYNKVPTIIGYNDMEGITYVGRYDDNNLKALYNNFAKALPDNLYFKSFLEKSKVANEIKTFYFKTKYQNSNLTASFIDYFSDMLFHYPSLATSEYLLQNDVTVYNYYFKYDSYRNIGKFVTGLKDRKGAAHGDELFYLFQPLILWPLPKFENDAAVIDRMTTIWTSFARTSIPKSPFVATKWIPSDSGHLKFLVIDQNSWISSTPNQRRMDFWNKIYSKYGS